MNNIGCGCGLIILSIIIWIAICYGFTHVVIWIANGFNYDLSDKFNYIFVGILLISYIFKR